MVLKRVAFARNGASSSSSVCQSCWRSLQRRHASAAAATAIAEPTPAPPDQRSSPVMAATVPHQTYDIHAGVVLSRPPLLTRDPTPFEREYFFYQRRLNERMTLPFTRYFYYAKNTPADLRWKRKMKERQIPARDLGGYNPYTRDAWNDEILVGDETSSQQKQVDALLGDALFEKNKKPGEEEGPNEAKEEPKAEKIKIEEQLAELPYSRVTEADRQRDLRSLNRALSRTLYLLVRREKGPWRFPHGPLQEKEDLYRASERLLVQAGGINMNTWVLRPPIGHYVRDFDRPQQDSQPERLGEKTFFMKARIMAGQPNLQGNALSLSDHRWLAKEEIQQEVSPGYWKAIKNMLVDL